MPPLLAQLAADALVLKISIFHQSSAYLLYIFLASLNSINPMMHQLLYLTKAFVTFLRNPFPCRFAGQNKFFAGVSCQERIKMQTGPELCIIRVIYKLAKEDVFILTSVTAS